MQKRHICNLHQGQFQGVLKMRKFVSMETRLKKLTAYIFQPCEWNHTKLTMIIFIDVLVT